VEHSFDIRTDPDQTGIFRSNPPSCDFAELDSTPAYGRHWWTIWDVLPLIPALGQRG
jgi:hypothetical protein